MRKQEQAAIEAVAAHFAATWEPGETRSGAHDAHIVIGRKRIAVEIATIRPRRGDSGPSKPHLRLDKVALRLIGRLQGALQDSVPDGKTLIVTVTAPIRLPGKTAQVMEDTIRTSIAQRKAAALDLTIHGNRIQARLVKGGAAESASVIGFVHNPDSNPQTLIDLTQALLESVGKALRKRTPAGSAHERWLVLASEDGPTDIEAYRHACSQMGLAVPVKTILMVFGAGRVETLIGREQVRRVSSDD